MSEPKFTKRPYRLDPYDCYSVRGYSTGTAKYPEKDGELVDSVLCSFNSHLLQTKANISLFLVAPEMYAMLERILDFKTGGPFISTNPTVTELAYLLKKARGEE